MTKNEATLLSKFMDDLSDIQGNAGCNDYSLKDTPENRKLLLAAEMWNVGVTTEAAWKKHDEYQEITARNGKLDTHDSLILGYLQHQ